MGKLKNLEVPSWTVSDVADWIKQIGFDKSGKVANLVQEYMVDGDLLLKLDESNLKEDLEITNSIHRKLFLRELDSLKRNADYSAFDTYGTVQLIRSSKRLELMVYAYNMIDIEPAFLAHLDRDEISSHLKETCGVKSALHREALVSILLESVTCCSNDSAVWSQHTSCESIPESQAQIYINFAGGNETNHLASLINLQLKRRNFSVIESVDCLNPASLSDKVKDHVEGKCQTLDMVEKSYAKWMARCTHYVVVLGEGALDAFTSERRIEEGQLQSPLYYEIVAALNSPTTTVIPVRMPSFRFPKDSDLWPEIRGLRMMNAITYYHEFQNACFDKTEWFILGEVFSRENYQARKTSSEGGSSLLGVPSCGSGFFSYKSRLSTAYDLTKMKVRA